MVWSEQTPCVAAEERNLRQEVVSFGGGVAQRDHGGRDVTHEHTDMNIVILNTHEAAAEAVSMGRLIGYMHTHVLFTFK